MAKVAIEPYNIPKNRKTILSVKKEGVKISFIKNKINLNKI